MQILIFPLILGVAFAPIVKADKSVPPPPKLILKDATQVKKENENKENKNKENAKEREATKEKPEKIKDAETVSFVSAKAKRFTLTYVGDCTFSSTQPNENSSLTFSKVVGDDYGYPFDNVKKYFEADDLTIANLECALTNATVRAKKRFTFRARPEYVNLLTNNSIEAVNLANNHSNDLLKKGKEQTVSLLSKNGVLYFEGQLVARFDKGDFKVGLVGYNGIGGSVSATRIAQVIRKLRKEGCNLIIASCHWGIEGRITPSAAQKNVAKTLIEAGADTVVGHHPHRLQPIARIDGKTVLYSLGNFCFGGNISPSNYDTVLVQEVFELRKGAAVSLGLRVVPCDQRSNKSKSRPDYKPTPVTGAAASRIYKQMNWSADKNLD